MSMKILNAWRFPGKNLEDLFQIIQGLRPLAVEKSKVFKDQFIVNIATCKIDNRVMVLSGLLPEPKEERVRGELFEAWKVFDSRMALVQKTKEFDPLDVSCSLSILMSSDKIPMVMVFCQNRQIQELVKEYLEKTGEDYSWWNHSDKPKSVKTVDWKNREKIWNEVFKDESKPDMAGLSAVVIPENFFHPCPSVSSIDAIQPSFEQRFKEIFRTVAVQAICESLKTTQVLSLDEQMTQIRNAEKMLREKTWSHYDEWHEKVSKALWPKIPKEAWTAEDLRPIHAQHEQGLLQKTLSESLSVENPRVRL